MNIDKGTGEGIGAARKTGTGRANNGLTTTHLGRTPGRRSPVALFALWPVFMIGGCGDGLKDVGQYERGETAESLPVIPDARQAIRLSPGAQTEHQGAMVQHLQTMEGIVDALAAGDFLLAQMRAEAHPMFFERRMALVRQRMETYPPAFQEQAAAHQAAADELARVMPSRDLAQILPRLSAVLKACSACHLAFRLERDNRGG
ncbi:MAG TPA: cytochrome c [Nitrospiraceae bacterium]|nr:cytochrome c [Nitrospiraceae bacterium]